MIDLKEQRTFKIGDVIMKQGEHGEAAYIIEQGKVEILLEKADGTEQRVGTRGPGAMIGEMAIVDNAPRTATVRAIENCELLEISANDFARRLLNADPVLRMTIQVILTRYRDTLVRADISNDTKAGFAAAESLEKNYLEQTDAVEAIKIENDFRSAMDKNDVEMHYQPMINLTDGQVAGFESLMRWFHQEKGFISPGIFIPVIEESGLIVTASQWALKASLKALKNIETKTGRDDLFMSVNFTSHDFSSPDFVKNIKKALKEEKVRPEQLHLEITERLLMGQPDVAKETLEECKNAGMSISIDDFGTGYSSLSYLHYFPIDKMKIDQSFVSNMMNDESSIAIVRAIVALGKNLNMKIIAEGIESLTEATMLKGIGCEYAQGYHFAKPMPESDAIEFVKNWKSPDF